MLVLFIHRKLCFSRRYTVTSNNPFIDISLKLKVSKLKSSELENHVKYLGETWPLNQHFWKTTLESIFLL